MAVSSEVKGSGFLCKFAVLGPLNTVVDTVSDKGATYIYRQASLTGRTWGLQKDKLYYFETAAWNTFPGAQATCRRIPGFRLSIIRTKEVMMALASPERAYYLDLQKKPGGIFEWGDSTRFTNPENIPVYFTETFTSTSTGPFIMPVFYCFRDHMHDQVLSNLERVVCQANPLGVDW